MENIVFTNSAFIAIGLQALLVTVLVCAVCIIWKKKNNEPFELFLIGAATFFISAMILENIPKVFILSIPSVKNKAFLTVIIASAFAGVFEETGRFIAFRTAMKKNHEKKNAVTYGIGHGGFEALLLIGISAVTYIVMGIMINAGNIDKITGELDDASKALVIEQLKGISQTTIPAALLGIVERISAITLHISLSVLVFAAAKNKKHIMLYPAAIVLHFGFDSLIALYQTQKVNAIQLEAILFVTALITAVAVYCFYKKLPQEVRDNERRMERDV